MAGNQANLVATGDQDSTINIIGSDVAGKGGTNLFADKDINILAAKQTGSERSKNKSSGWNAGVALDFSNGVSLGITAGANYGKGHGNGDNVVYRHSHVGDAGSQTNITAGDTLTLRGAQAIGKGVKVKAKDLNIESVQDSATYHGKQMNASAQVTVGYGVSGSANYSQSKINADHLSVTEQSGILAGDDGFNVNIQNHTNLKGGIITSTAKAEAEGKNTFSTGTISTSNLQNHSQYDASGFGIGGGFAMGGGKADQKTTKDKDSTQTEQNHQTQNTTEKQRLPENKGIHLAEQGSGAYKSVGYGSDSDSQNSTTVAGINTSNITITDKAGQQNIQSNALNTASLNTTLSSDDVFANQGLKNRFDKDAVQKEINTQVAVTQEFDKTRQGVKQILNEKIDTLKTKVEKGEAPQSELDNWQMASLIVDGISGALYTPNTNGIIGDVAQVAAPHVAKQIGDYFAQPSNNNKAAHGLAHTVLAAAVAAAGGNDALTAGLSAGGAELAAPVVSKWLYGETDGSKLTAEQKATVSNITSLIGTAAGASTGNVTDIASSTQAATNAVENNGQYFHETDPSKRNDISDEDALRMKAMIGFVLPIDIAEALAKAETDEEKRNILISNLPVIRTIKGVKEAESVGDYTFALIDALSLGGSALNKANKAKDAFNIAKATGDTKGMKKAISEGSKVIQGLPAPKSALARRNTPGKAYSSGSLTEIKAGTNWFNKTNEAPFPKQIADKMSGKSYNNFDEFRKDFWIKVSNDPVLSHQFNKRNIQEMRNGRAPFATSNQQVGGRVKLELDHNIEIKNNGLVYDFKNIIIRTPKNHIDKTTGK